MPIEAKKKTPPDEDSIEAILEKMTPENRAIYDKFMKWQKGKEGLVDTTALIREIRGHTD